jgi:hypothetical protein
MKTTANNTISLDCSFCINSNSLNGSAHAFFIDVGRTPKVSISPCPQTGGHVFLAEVIYKAQYVNVILTMQPCSAISEVGDLK